MDQPSTDDQDQMDQPSTDDQDQMDNPPEDSPMDDSSGSPDDEDQPQ